MLLFALACAGTTADTAPTETGDEPIPWSYPLDDMLRLTDAQVVATHNSTHIAPDPYVVPDWDYTMPTLTEQLRLGVRSVELDVHQAGDTFEVYHVETFDDTVTCGHLDVCLDELAAWSARNPAHFPLYVQLEPKDETGGDPITAWDTFDQILRDHGPPMFTPADLRGGHATLAEALADGGWPTLGDLRGKVIYGMDDEEAHRDTYRARGGGLVFLDGLPGDEDAAIAIVNDPDSTDLPGAIEAGFLTRVIVDTATDTPEERTAVRDAGLSSGAHILSTDYPEDTGGIPGFVIPGGSPVGCNPATAPPECTAAALEDPAFIQD